MDVKALQESPRVEVIYAPNPPGKVLLPMKIAIGNRGDGPQTPPIWALGLNNLLLPNKLFRPVYKVFNGRPVFMASDEAAILHQAIGGNPAAFESLVRTYQKKAYIVAYGFVGNREDAVDLAQESFARAFKALNRFDESLPFYPWLHRIIRNVCLNFLRKKRRHGEISLNDMVDKGYDPPDDETPDRTAELGELSKAISAAMFQLPHDQREILGLRHLQEMSYSEIATCLGIPQGTVMSRLHSARVNLRGLLEDVKESSLGPRKED